MTVQETEEIKEEDPSIALSEFLESVSPGAITNISGLTAPWRYVNGQLGGYRFAKPDVQLHCPSEACNGTRFFRCNDDHIDVEEGKWQFIYVTYRCSNCQDSEKTFSLALRLENNSTDGQCYKFGELPSYGPPVPSRLIKMIGPDRELFLKGRRCENQGLGIGAFVYYRRVVESQKNRILDEIIKVSKKLDASPEAISKLESAKAESRFSQALKDVKGAVPQTLLINGHNPLLLLHSALSDGLHDRTDEHCLEVAASVRVVLGELAERLSQALKDEAELTRALAKLMNPASD